MTVYYTKTQSILGAIRTNLTGIELEMSACYPDDPDWNTVKACLANVANFHAMLVTHLNEQIPSNE